MYNMNRRDAILQATKTLLWERGYEATSPRDIQDLSKAGQGSFYHHFRTKRDLAAEAIQQVVSERIEAFESTMAGNEPLKARIQRFLHQRKEPLKGCRIGRMVWDSAVQDEKLRKPLEQYFRHLEERLRRELDGAVKQGKIKILLPSEQIALLIVAAIQGGYTVSRAMQQARVNDAVVALEQFLDISIIER